MYKREAPIFSPAGPEHSRSVRKYTSNHWRQRTSVQRGQESSAWQQLQTAFYLRSKDLEKRLNLLILGLELKSLSACEFFYVWDDTQ